MIYFLLPVGSRKFVQWPRPWHERALLIVFTPFSLRLCRGGHGEKSTLNTGFPFLPRPAGNLYAKLASAATHVQGARSPVNVAQREREREREKRAQRDRKKGGEGKKERLYYHVVPAEICMRKRANAITRRRHRRSSEKNVAARPTFPPIIRAFPAASVTFVDARPMELFKGLFLRAVSLPPFSFSFSLSLFALPRA